MNPVVNQFLNLLFNPKETFCVSCNKYGYHSIDMTDIHRNRIPLFSPNPDVKPQSITTDDIALVALNPIQGYRNDESVTAYRTFLVELDTDSLPEQQKYVEEMDMPFSVCVFSGNKSLHYGIVLDEDLQSEQIYKTIAEWILNIMTKADQQTKNPSRSIRFPGHYRKDGRKLIQQLVEIKGRVKKNDLFTWLNKHEDKKPKPEPIKVPKFRDALPSLESIPKHIRDWLEDGIHNLDERNNKWFLTAMAFAEANFEEDETVEILEQFFDEQRDFDRKEWRTAIQSAYKRYDRGE